MGGGEIKGVIKRVKKYLKVEYYINKSVMKSWKLERKEKEEI